jgi:dienelactone hydrolase
MLQDPGSRYNSVLLFERRAILTAILFCISLSNAFGQTLEVSPPRIMADESAVIRARGLEPHERVAIRAELTDGGAQVWASEADFIADDQGIVDASTQQPVAGSYKGLSSMGLIWSMRPSAKKVSAYTRIQNEGPQPILFQLLRKGQSVSKANLEQVFIAQGVEQVPLHAGPLRGVLYAPSGGRHAGVLVVGGSNGGLPRRPAAWLASHGFAALALAYFRYQDLPPQLEGIPLEYFALALDWMSHRPEISGMRFAVTGSSRGGELALQLGSMYPRIAAVVAYVPANVRYAACCRQDGGPAWLWQGRPLPYLLPRFGRQAAALDAAIAVEKTHGPILMISGEDDHLWPSWEMADAVVSRLKHERFPYLYENLKYRHAGHFAGHPEIVPAWHGQVRNPTSGRLSDVGGSAAGDAESSIDSMPKVLQFLKNALENL